MIPWKSLWPFLGWLNDRLERFGDLQLGDKQVTSNYLVQQLSWQTKTDLFDVFKRVYINASRKNCTKKYSVISGTCTKKLRPKIRRLDICSRSQFFPCHSMLQNLDFACSGLGKSLKYSPKWWFWWWFTMVQSAKKITGEESKKIGDTPKKQVSSQTIAHLWVFFSPLLGPTTRHYMTPIQTMHSSGQIITFHEPRFHWNRTISLTEPPFGVKSWEFDEIIIRKIPSKLS